MKVAFKKTTTSFFGRLIKIWTRGDFCHTELCFADGHWFSSDEADDGCRFIFGPKEGVEYDYIEIPVSTEDEARIRRFCEKEEGCKYDKKGIGFSFLPIPIGYQSESRWFCSEICTAALQMAGWCTGYTPARVHPNKLHKILTKEREQWVKSKRGSLRTAGQLLPEG